MFYSMQSAVSMGPLAATAIQTDMVGCLFTGYHFIFACDDFIHKSNFM